MQGLTQRKSAESPVDRVIERVLIVDDSRLQRRILSALLKREGYEVVEASSGAEGLLACEAAEPDLILSDWVMPEMDGLTFCRAFRKREARQDGYGYFILLTSKGEKEEIAKGFESGADDFLTKPVNAHELRARISAGERILKMQRELTQKNRVISDTLSELQRVYDSLDHDLIEAKKLQQSLVRDRFKRFEQGSIAMSLHSSGHVGGDLVGHFPITAHRVGLFAIDVSGHGISSALMTARLAGYLGSASPEQNVALWKRPEGGYDAHPPSRVVKALNTLLLSELETEHYFTMVLADVDLSTGRVVMTQAGHPRPIVQNSAGDLTSVGQGGLPVGLIETAEYSQFELTLARGDRLLILSDGVSECYNPEGAMLGEERLDALLRELSDVGGEAFFEALLWKLGEFAGHSRFSDDISGILLEYTGPTADDARGLR